MRPLSGYPQPAGAKLQSVFPHAGPASYTQVTSGSAPAVSTGGDTVRASEAGMKQFDWVSGGVSDSGTYRVEVCYNAVSGVVAAPTQLSVPQTAVRLRWYVVSTGAEAAGSANLSAEIVRLRACGN